MAVDPERIRCVDPLVSPQYPFDEAPRPPERSEPRYASISDYEARIPMRDGVRLAADVIRPSAAGLKFPALLRHSGGSMDPIPDLSDRQARRNLAFADGCQ